MDSDDLTFDQWLKLFAANPFGFGVKGFALLVSVLSATAFLVPLGAVVFPSGRYPAVLLAIPGLLVSGAYFFIVASFIHKLNAIASVIICAVPCAGFIYGVSVTY